MTILALLVPAYWTPDHSGADWTWIHSSGARGIAGQDQPPVFDRVRLILPFQDVLTHALAIERKGRWKETLPYLIEDQLLSEPERLHLLTGAVTPDGLTPLFAMDRERLKAVVAESIRLGFSPTEAYPETVFDAPVYPDERLVLEGGSAWRIRSGGVVMGFAIPERGHEEGSAQRELGLERFLSNPVGPDLLTGGLRPRQPGILGFIPKSYRGALLLVLAALLVEVSLFLGQTAYWWLEDVRTPQRLAAALHSVDPNAPVSSDVPKQLSQLLERERQTHVGAGAFGQALQSTEGILALNAGKIRAVHYESNHLSLELTCEAKSCVDRVREWSAAHHWSMKPSEAQPLVLILSPGGAP